MLIEREIGRERGAEGEGGLDKVMQLSSCTCTDEL